jgi:hypothetical protein
MLSQKQLAFIALANLIAVFGISLMPPVAQPISYHQFSDTHSLLGIPNFWNVFSNLPYLVCGALLLKYAIQVRSKDLSIWIFGVSLSLVSFGSSYYHWQPDTASLFWDRLPIVIGFMALFNLFLKDYISVKLAKASLWPTLFLAILALLYWRYTEQIAQGDMRAYLLVQIIPILTISIGVAVHRSHRCALAYTLLLVSYAVAKGFELVDHFQIEQWLVVSGHTWKHLISGTGLAIFAHQYLKLRLGSQGK